MLRPRSPVEDKAEGPVEQAPDEVDLIARIAAEDLRAFETLYRLYHPRLSRFLVNLIRRPQLVEEALNDTMMVVWERAGSFNRTSKVSTWVFAIAYRKALKALRRWDEPVDDQALEFRPSLELDAEQQLGGRQLRNGLIGALDNLSADHRAVVDLAYFQDLGYREISEIMGCPVDTVKTRMFHARRHLKAMMAGQLTDWL